MIYQSLKASEILKEKWISATVLNVYTIKPLYTRSIDKLMNHKFIVTVEEHNVIGGLGSAVSEHLSPKFKRPPPYTYRNKGFLSKSRRLSVLTGTIQFDSAANCKQDIESI